ncbi:MAG: S8 family peptidase [Chitinophagaceae bacterium]
MAEGNQKMGKAPLPGSSPDDPKFTPYVLDRTIIAIPLLNRIKVEDLTREKIATLIQEAASKGKVPRKLPDFEIYDEAEKKDILNLIKEAAKKRELLPYLLPVKVYDIVIDLHLSFKGGREEAQKRVKKMIEDIQEEETPKREDILINHVKTDISRQYVFASLSGEMIRKLVQEDNKQLIPDDNKGDNTKPKDTGKSFRAIYRIWPDFDVKAFITKSISTVKADAARSSFSAFGEGITWAVIDSGIDASHPHFIKHENIHDSHHKDFTATTEEKAKPFDDGFGHGTHVAGIIAGEIVDEIKAVVRHRDEFGEIVFKETIEKKISGMAPQCKLVSLKVLDGEGKGKASSLIVSIEYIQEINSFGRELKIQGVNMSLGYDFDPEWFACGQSPLCVEVDRLVKSGVVVVVAAGNTGYGFVKSAFRNVVAAGMPLSINDPGNAEFAITVGSTHRNMPHTYGVSYFSSKGPTGDGRLKPDLVAPGEKIISCAAGEKKKDAETQMQGQGNCLYVEDSGTSMAAPHVSGVIAAFLSIRKEYIGKPEVVKAIFLNTATDLKRDRYFQGHGLIDLMRAIQSV